MSVRSLLVEIESRTEGDLWTIPLDEVLTHLNLPREDYYKHVYSMRARGAHTLFDFDASTTKELIELCEFKTGKPCEETFYKAGYYINEERLRYWEEFFLSITLSKLQSHVIDHDELETAISGCRFYEDAFDFYCELAFDFKEIQSFACRLFLQQGGIEEHALSRSILLKHLDKLFRRGILDKKDIFHSFHESLYKRAVDWHLVDDEVRFRTSTVEISDEIIQALQVLHLSLLNLPSQEELKTAYRKQMKIHHPDINPEGTEASRKINAAYAFLLNRLRS